MTAYDVLLAEQNTGTSWRDCNAAGIPHRWVPEIEIVPDGPGPIISYWSCRRCPVRTRKSIGVSSRSVPQPFLRHAAGCPGCKGR